MKQEELILTPENYQDYSPSTLVRSFLADIELMQKRSKKLGKPCNMGSFSDGVECLGCLGGHAVLSWNGKEKIDAYALEENILLRHIAYLGDCIRRGSLKSAVYWLGYLFPKKRKKLDKLKTPCVLKLSVYDVVLPHEYDNLIKIVNIFADFLEENDL